HIWNKTLLASECPLALTAPPRLVGACPDPVDSFDAILRQPTREPVERGGQRNAPEYSGRAPEHQQYCYQRWHCSCGLRCGRELSCKPEHARPRAELQHYRDVYSLGSGDANGHAHGNGRRARKAADRRTEWNGYGVGGCYTRQFEYRRCGRGLYQPDAVG